MLASRISLNGGFSSFQKNIENDLWGAKKEQTHSPPTWFQF